MDVEQRRRLAAATLEGYAHGPHAPTEATARALAAANAARAVVLVEGISDQIAVETAAVRLGRDLEAAGIVIVPIGGASEIARYLAMFGPTGAALPISGLCDAGVEHLFRRRLAAAGVGAAQSRTEMEQLGFFVCVKDLEEELIRASDRDGIEVLLESQGDLGAFRTLQRQPEWRHQSFDSQMHRWLRAGARRNLRYARLLIESLAPDRIPHPLTALLTHAGAAG